MDHSKLSRRAPRVEAACFRERYHLQRGTLAFPDDDQILRAEDMRSSSAATSSRPWEQPSPKRRSRGVCPGANQPELQLRGMRQISG